MTQHTPNILVGVTDEFDQEEQAMLLAMYSRSYAPIMSRLPQTEEARSSLRSRLLKYYQGYGHKSVGQLGGTTIFFEGVSQIAAKALEDNQLFNGQESSTRYVDYRNQPMVDCGDERIRGFQEELRELYIDAFAEVKQRLVKEYPLEDQEGTGEISIGIWNNTINSQAFDICRGILPAGVVTNVGYKGTFDNLNDHLTFLLNHPCDEVRDIAAKSIDAAHEKYPNGMIARRVDDSEEAKAAQTLLKPAYYYNHRVGDCTLRLTTTPTLFERHALIRQINDRKKKGQTLPKLLASSLRMVLNDQLDFGSFRDLQRHRNGVCPIPLLTPHLGIHEWYLQKLGPELATRLENILAKIQEAQKEIDPYQLQYAVPMGALVTTYYECDLNQWIYLLELRTGKTVHQTLRKLMQKVYFRLCETLSLDPDKSGIYVDLTDDNFTLKRGKQTFTKEFES